MTGRVTDETRSRGGGSLVFASEDMTDGPGRGTRPSVASPLWLCDGYPTCRFDGTRAAVREHMKACPDSDAGAIYRVLAWAGAQR